MREAGRDPGYFMGRAAGPADTGHAGTDRSSWLKATKYIVGADDHARSSAHHARALLLSRWSTDHFNAFPTIQSYEAPFGELIARVAG